MAYFHFGIQIQITARFSFIPWQGHKKTLMSSMSQQGGKSMRPICPSCSKPTKTCLCSRILNPPIPNSVNVTILQHALECKHPLNSARIARLGLKNLTIATVSDVNFQARFDIHLLDPNSHLSSVNGNVPNGLFSTEIGETHDLFSEKVSNFIDSAGLENDVKKVCSVSGAVDVNDQVEKNPFGLFSNEIGKTQKLFSEKDSNFIDSAGMKIDVNKVSSIGDGVDVNDQVENQPDGLFSNEIGETQKLFFEKDSNLIDSAGLNNDVNKVCSISDGVDVNDQVENNPLQPNGLFSDEIGETQKLFSEKDSNLIDSASLKNDVNKLSSISDGVDVNDVEKNPLQPICYLSRGVHEENGGPAITFTIAKNGAISSLSHIWMQQCQSPMLSFDKILSCAEACEALSKGFLVKKFQRKQLMYREVNMEEYKEFELEVCPGSVLLFPSDDAVSVSDLNDIGFEAKNLIVLDGTWAKAKRIYSENPWLNILPHLKLEVNEASLYSEVRRQPKAGYLSTIESIVFTLKAVGENHEGLDNLLDTFESMVGDQRRCRDERLSKEAEELEEATKSTIETTF